MQSLHIFRSGTHISSNGASLAFSDTDLRAMVAAYDPAKHEAPIVVGHPKDNAPAYGWVKSLEFADGVQAQPHQVQPQFAEMVNAKLFKKISASFYTPDSPSNPVPGVYYLRHVGFLGAQPPAVKGLRDASFADSEQGIVEFGDFGGEQDASLWRQMRDWIIGKFGADEANKVIPGIVEDAARAQPADEVTPTSNYSEEDQRMLQNLAEQQAELKKQQDALAAQQVEFTEREQKLKDAEARSQRAACAEFIDGLVKAGKFLPVYQSGALEFMSALPEGAVIEFGEGDAKTKQAPAEWFRGFLSAQPVQVTFGETAPTAPIAPTDPTLIAKLAHEFQEAEASAGRVINFAQAVAHVAPKN